MLLQNNLAQLPCAKFVCIFHRIKSFWLEILKSFMSEILSKVDLFELFVYIFDPPVDLSINLHAWGHESGFHTVHLADVVSLLI